MAHLTDAIGGGYLKDILDQPRAIEDTLAALAGQPVPARLRDPGPDGWRRVVLTGMGSSFHAFQPMLIELCEAGLPVTLVETSELIHYRRALLAPGTLTIALSQSGRSAEIVRLLEMIRGHSALIGVTNEPDSPLARCADTAVLLRAGAESTVSTKTYVASLAALAWLGGTLRGRDPAAALREFEEAPGAAALYLDRWEERVREAIEEFRGVDHLFLAGRGPSLAAAGVGGLIAKESAHFHAEGMSAAAFRHGPIEMAGRNVFLAVFEGDERTAHLNRRLHSDVKLAGGRAALIRESAEHGLFRIPPASARVRPILEILPVQMITLAVAALAGHEAGAFGRATKVTVVE